MTTLFKLFIGTMSALMLIISMSAIVFLVFFFLPREAVTGPALLATSQQEYHPGDPLYVATTVQRNFNAPVDFDVNMRCGNFVYNVRNMRGLQSRRDEQPTTFPSSYLGVIPLESHRDLTEIGAPFECYIESIGGYRVSILPGVTKTLQAVYTSNAFTLSVEE